MNEKGSIALADGFKAAPACLKERVEIAFKQMSHSRDAISTTINTLYSVLEDCKLLVP